MSFYYGDRVVCVNNKGYSWLTLGKEYKILSVDYGKKSVYVTDDGGDDIWFEERRFEKVGDIIATIKVKCDSTKHKELLESLVDFKYASAFDCVSRMSVNLAALKPKTAQQIKLEQLQQQKEEIQKQIDELSK